MKQLTCEMCGSTDLMKQDGVFVCQTCGTKYTVEEAKKMMVEVSGGTVEVKNAAQLENLFKLARSSFDSKNYAQAEEFCNQVIAMDDKIYEAWKLKGEAINYQITSKNQRILEVYNCIMTSFRVLDDEGKEDKKEEILSSLKVCFEGEVTFWLEQFEANRPTDASLTRAKNAYVDAYNKLADAFDELGLEDAKEGYLYSFDNYFMGECNRICTSAWKTTVGYNYYRDYMGKGKDPFGEFDHTFVIDSDRYRPVEKTWKTFLDETEKLISLLQFAAEQLNYASNTKVLESIYNNMVYIQECAITSKCWKITHDRFGNVGWGPHFSLAESAKNARFAAIRKYKADKDLALSKIKLEKQIKESLERKERINKYWEEHSAEKAKLDKEQNELKAKVDKLNAQISDIDKKNAGKIQELTDERNKKLPCEEDVDKQLAFISDLETQKKNLGLFKGKEKKAIQARIDDEEMPKLEALKKKASEEKKAHQDKIDAKIDCLKNDGKELRDEVAKLNKRNDEITKELTKDR